MNMKKNTLIAFIVFLPVSLVFLSACGGGGEGVPTPITVVPPPVVDNPKEDMGLLPTVNSDENNTNNVLNLQAIKYDDVSSELSKLKVCTDTACWTVLDSNGQAKSALAAKKTSKLTNRTSLTDVGSYDLSVIDGVISSIEYLYNAKEGEMKLSNSVPTDQELRKDLYLEMKENLTVPFSSLSIENGRNGIFIPNEDFKKEFINGVIIEVEKGSTDEMANLYIKKIGELVDERSEANFHLIKFYALNYNFEDLREVKNKFPKKFQKEINVYLPINFSSSLSDNQYTDYMKANYVLTVNNSELDYKVALKNNQHYLFFKTDNTTIKVLFFDK